ncbi:MAG: hypothetical protein R6X34_23240 [Chloroflexota bacterium]|jgi:hypothetical protein
MTTKIDWKRTEAYELNQVEGIPSGPKCKLSLVLSVRIGKAAEDEPVIVWASLEGSKIGSGKLYYNSDVEKGYFQDSVSVKMFIHDSRDRVYKDLMRIDDSPDTDNMGGSVTSSVTISFNDGGNVGFFGGMATGGASGSFGVSSTNSFTESLKDFEVRNDSDSFVVNHQYYMAKSSGGIYRKAADLVPDPNHMEFFDHFKEVTLYDPPPLATSNLPLMSQAYWQATHTRPIKDHLKIKVLVVQNLSYAWGHRDFAVIKNKTKGETNSYWYDEPLGLHRLVDSDHGAPLT